MSNQDFSKTDFNFFSENRLIQVQKEYQRDGFIYLKNVFNSSLLDKILWELKNAEDNALKDLEDEWNGNKICFFTKEKIEKGNSTDEENFVNTDYFKKSEDKVHIFFEAIDSQIVLNRLGHGLHRSSKYPLMKSFIYNNHNLNELLKLLSYKAPICLLSAYIPKYPNNAGSRVRPHQESTFAHTTPQSCCVLWVALEDATIENACMWGIKGSNQLPLGHISKVDHKNKKRDYVEINELKIPCFETQREHYTPLEVKAGDAIIFDGNFIHCSSLNSSTRSRKALTFQFIETKDTQFSDFNWIETPNEEFLYNLSES